MDTSVKFAAKILFSQKMAGGCAIVSLNNSSFGKRLILSHSLIKLFYEYFFWLETVAGSGSPESGPDS